MKNNITRKVVLKSFFNTFLKNQLNKRSRVFLEKGYPQILSFQFDSISNVIAVDGIYEKVLLENIFEFLVGKDLINGYAIDVGANIGNHSLYFSNFFRKVYAIEPNPKIFKILEINISNYEKIKAYNLGFGKFNTKGSITIGNKQNLMGSKIDIIKSNESRNKEKHVIDIIKIDEFVNSLDGKVGLIKIDVEGMELEVLRGGQNTIENDRPVILFEQHKRDFKNGNSFVINFLKDLGYGIYVARFHPKRSPYLSNLGKIINHLRSLIFGASFILEKNNSPKPDFYPMLLGIPE